MTIEYRQSGWLDSKHRIPHPMKSLAEIGELEGLPTIARYSHPDGTSIEIAGNTPAEAEAKLRLKLPAWLKRKERG